MNKLMVFVLMGIAFITTGCDDRFRYPCQDPKNWEKDECKPPICTATVTCPDDLTKPHQEQR